MVTKRKIGFILLLIVSMIIFVWNFSSLNEILKRKIIEDIYRASKGTVLLEAKNLGIGPGYVAIDSVFVKNETPNTQFSLQIKRVKIYFRIWPLFIFKTSLPNLLTGIVLEEPEFVINMKKQENVKTAEDNDTNFIKIEQFFKLNRHLPSFELRNAKFSVYHLQEKWISFSDLSGNLQKKKNGIISAYISDQEESNPSIRIEIEYLPDSGRVINVIDLNHFAAEKIHLLQLDQPVKIDEGIFDGTVKLYADLSKFDDLDINGQLKLVSLSGEFYQKFFSCDSLWMNIENNRFEIQPSPLLFGSNEIEWAMEGELRPDFKLMGYFFSNEFDLSTLNFYMPEGDSLNGLVRLTGMFNYGTDTFLKTSFSADRIYYRSWSQENVEGQAILKDSIVRLHVNTRNHIYEFGSDLNYNLKSGEFTGSLDGKYQLQANIPILSGLDSNWIFFKTNFGGDLKSHAVRGLLDMKVTENEMTRFAPSGEFVYEDHQITFQVKDTTRKSPLSLSLEISELNKKPLVNILELYNFPLETFFDKKYLKYIPGDMLVSFYLAGVPEFLQGKIRLFSSRTEDEILEFSGKAEKLFTEFASLKGDLFIYTRNKEIQGRTFIASQPQKWHGFFYLGDFFKADLEFDLQDEEPVINVTTILDKLELTALSSELDSLKWNGIVSGQLEMHGPLSNPSGTLITHLEDVILNGVGYIDLDLGGKFENSTISIDSLYAQLNNVPFIQGHLAANLSTYELTGRLQGAGVELYNFSEMILGNRDLIKGNTNYTIELMPSASGYPKININVDVFDGEIAGEKISELHFKAVDSLVDWNPFNKNVHHLTINQLNWKSELGYRGWADGVFSFVPGIESDLKVHLVGNVLAHLKRFIPFFTKIDVEGDVKASIVGPWENLSIGDFEMEITDGNMQFERVMKPLHHIRAYITKRRNSPFVQIHRLEGFFENSFAHIHNEEQVTLSDGRTLVPWYFEGLNLNFGTLVLQTVPTGIPLNIPGMQEPGDFGYFAVKGMNEKEEFYFSGPADHPVVRGTVIGRNARVTFPFLETEGSDPENPGKVVEFLMGINWDVRAIADKGMYYFVEIPAYVGKVYMELNVDMNSPGLHFTGTLNDESFRVEGEVFSYKGDVEYLETNFRVEKFGAVFNKLELFPEVYGRAFTTVRDSLNIPHEIFLQLYAIDPETKQEVQRGRWEDFRFKLVSNEPVVGDNQELVLAQMGYSVKNLSSKVTEVGSQLTENLLIRPLVRPLERFLEKRLNLDYVRFRSAVAKNLMNYSLGSQFKWWNRENSLNLFNPYLSPDPTLILLQSSELTLGKYLERNLYLSYTMQLMAMYESVDLHLNQKINLEYRLMKNFLLEFEYDYFRYNQYRFLGYDKPYDFIIRLRHSFNF